MNVGNFEEISCLAPFLLFRKIIHYQPAPDTQEERFFFVTILKPFEKKAKELPLIWVPILQDVIYIIEQVIGTLDLSIKSRWDLTLQFHKGQAMYLLNEYRQAYSLLRKVSKQAIIEKYWEIGDESAVLTSFPMSEQHPSISDFGESNYELFVCREGLGLNHDMITNLGVNMFRYWSGIICNRLAIKDLQINEFLLESAKKLKEEGFTENEAALIMVALLLKVFQHNKKHDKLLSFSRTPPDAILKRLKE